jgi:multidrug efflux pump subunit AcrB
MSLELGPAGRLARFFIDSKLTPLLVLASLGLGLVAVVLTPREEEPQIVVPVVDLFVGLPGASPEEVESRATIPLEKRMWEIPGVEYIYSTSMPGLCLVTVRFRVGQDEVNSLVKVYEKITSGLDRLQEGFTMPLAKLRSIDDVPALALTLWSREADGFVLRRLAAELEREIAHIDEVSETKLIGGRRREMRVLLSPARMAAFGVDPAAVAAALQAQNSSIPAGTFESGGREVRVETGAFLRDTNEMAALVVGVHDGRPVHLRDVAEVVDGPEEVRDYVFFAPGPAASLELAPGPTDDLLSPAVTLAVAKRKGSDASRVVEAVLAKVDMLRGRLLPPEVNVTVTRDYGETASEKAGELLTHLTVAILSVTVVVALFLGWRGGLVVFVSVPVTFALTLFVYYLFDYTLNRVTLFALIFVTGIVVDDSIIVVENIVRHLSTRRRPPLEAAVEAVNEVGNPTILATLTVIAAVLPMAFVRGLMGPYMRPMPVGASLAMTFSLFIALVATPWFAYRLVRGETGEGGGEYSLEKTRTHRAYRAIMEPLMRRRALAWVFLAGVIVLLLASVILFPLKWVTVKMLPFDNKNEMQVIIDMPEGTTLETTSGVAREIAGYLHTVPEVTNLQIYAGTAAPVNFNGLVRHYDLREGAHVADLQVNLVHKEHRGDQSHDLARRLRDPIQAMARRHQAAVKIVEIPPGPPVLSTLVAEIFGPTDAARLELAGRIREIFESTEGVVDVDWSVEAHQPKAVLRVDREKAALHGVAPDAVGRTLRLALQGELAGILRDPREAETVSIRLQLPLAERSSVEDLARVKVFSRSGVLVPLVEVVQVEETTEAFSRHRKNLRPVIYVTGEVAGSEESPVYAILGMAGAINALRAPGGAAVEQYYRDEPLSEERPAMKWDGEWHITYEVFRDLGISFGLVLVLIYLLIIGWFGSLSVPLVMMIAIPLALVGVLPGHWLFGAFFTATSMIGFIALAGIMVRNSVLLIDFVNLARREGRSLEEAVVAAGAVRFRPILLTAGTVVVGAFVILFDPIFQGLAISLMTGAIASTVLTLLVVPLVHFMIGAAPRSGRVRRE